MVRDGVVQIDTVDRRVVQVVVPEHERTTRLHADLQERARAGAIGCEQIGVDLLVAVIRRFVGAVRKSVDAERLDDGKEVVHC